MFSDNVLTSPIYHIPTHYIFSLDNIVSWVGDARYIWKVWWGALGQRGVTALHQEFTVIDYSSTPRSG